MSDLGETLSWLRMQSVARKWTIKQKQLVNDVCVTLGIEQFRGMLQVRVRSDAESAAAVMRLGQVAVRVADLWFTFHTRRGGGDG